MSSMDTKAWIAKTRKEHDALADKYGDLGYRFISVSIYGTGLVPLYAAVMVKRAQIVAQRAFSLQTLDEFEAEFDKQAKQGFGPRLIACRGDTHPQLISVFEEFDPIPLTRTRLKSGSAADPQTIEGMHRRARIKGLIPSTVATYGSPADPRFVAVWVPNPDRTTWNADGVNETGAQYVARFEAHAAGWCRPVFLGLDEDLRYASVFADSQVGSWASFHKMTEAVCHDTLEKLPTEKDLHPICIQGAGAVKTSARYAGIFVRSETPKAKKWQSSSLRPNAAIDEVLSTTLQNTPGRQASLAIVRAGKLVYAGGYTWAESGWPLTEPETLFRIGSCSKIVSALAAYQLMEEQGALLAGFDLDTPVQSLLHVAQPDGSAPADSRFGSITVRHLLEHTSGVDATAHRRDTEALAAHLAVKPLGGWHRPVSSAMTDAYIATLPLAHAPGKAYDGYNNCGYYLLGRVLAKARAASTQVAALNHLFKPLGITRIRAARSLVGDQPDDEARYLLRPVGKDDDARLEVGVDRSAMTDDQPLVPAGYGDLYLEKLPGSGGLSAAATDLAMLLAVVISQKDSPAMKRSTVIAMLDNGVANLASHAGAEDNRAGHGWDSVAARANGRYAGRKGGSLSTCGCWVQFKDDWGFVMNWATKLIADYQGVELRNFMPPVMSAAMAENWPSEDLFPAYGLVSL